MRRHRQFFGPLVYNFYSKALEKSGPFFITTSFSHHLTFVLQILKKELFYTSSIFSTQKPFWEGHT